MADLAHAADNDTDLIGDTAAEHWAERFAHVRAKVLESDGRDIAAEEDTMLGWFATAIETGRDVGFAEGVRRPTAQVVRRVIAGLGHDFGPAFIAQLAAEVGQPAPIGDALASEVPKGAGVAGT